MKLVGSMKICGQEITSFVFPYLTQTQCPPARLIARLRMKVLLKNKAARVPSTMRRIILWAFY